MRKNGSRLISLRQYRLTDLFLFAVILTLKKGVYRQKAVLPADGITLTGEGCGQTVITFDDYARKIHADGQEYNTFRTYTLCVIRGKHGFLPVYALF